jgi:hypothetical protein
MLNRTNRTLSATTNWLNLGTRSLAASANVNTGALTLRIRTDLHDRMHDGMLGYRPSPIPIPISIRSSRVVGVPVFPDSPPVSSRPVSSREVLAEVEFAAEPLGTAVRPCQSGEPFQLQQPSREWSVRWQGHSKRDRKPSPSYGKRSPEGCVSGLSLARATSATGTAAYAASGG